MADKTSDELYSTAELNRFCEGAQAIIANTELEFESVLYEDIGVSGVPSPPAPSPIPSTGFVGSVAQPYDGEEDLPLTTTQHIGYGLNDEGQRYPRTIMCKMKSPEALNFYFPGSSSSGSTCSTINEDTYKRVVNSIVGSDAAVVTEFVFDEWETYSGQQWTSQAPAVTAYKSATDGKLHVVGKSLNVERDNPSPFVGANKKGVHYCQVIAPAYLREIVTGRIAAPSCDAPPVYKPLTGPPPPPLLWNCQTP